MTGFPPPGGPHAGDVPSYTGPPVTGYPPAQPYGQYQASLSYPQPGYRYPPGYPGLGYPAYPWPGQYPGYAADPRDVRPGMAMAAAVLGYVNAGLLILAGGLLLVGSSIVADIESATDSYTSYAAEVFVDGVINLIVAALLITGGVMITGRKARGRMLLSVGNGIVVAAAAYWLARWLPVTNANGLIFYALLFAGMAIVSGILSWLTPVTVWLTRRR